MEEGSDYSNMTKNKEGKDSPDIHGCLAGLVLKDKNK